MDVIWTKNASMIFIHLIQSFFFHITSSNFRRTKTWTTLKVNGIPPAAREGHTATVIGSTMYLFGGSGNNAYFNDLYAFDLETVRY